MNSSTNEEKTNKTDYSVIIPLSMAFAILAIIITLFILIIVISRKRLHTVTRLLTCNTCLASILYCVVQCNNYGYLLVSTSDKSDESCRWRGYFGYMSIVAFIYSYVIQVISRSFFIVFCMKYRWLTSFKVHFYLIFFGWIIILFVPSPAILTNDIYFRPAELCWVTSKYKLHTYYVIIAYYVLPIFLIAALNIAIYIQIYSNGKCTTIQRSVKRRDRDYEIYRNIMISFGVYFLGGVPLTIYIFTDIEFFYSMGIVSVTLAVVMEKLVIIYLDQDIRNLLKISLYQRKTRVMPMTLNGTLTIRY